MYLKKILKFSEFLGQSPGSYNEIARFLVMDSFQDQGGLSVYIGELKSTGAIYPLGIFGWSPKAYEAFSEIPFNLNLPICDAIRDSEIISVTNGALFYERYPLMLGVKFTEPWNSGVALPCYPMGGLVATFTENLEMTDSMQLFFTAIGSLLGLYASQSGNVAPLMGGKKIGEVNLETSALTDRQLVVAEMIEQGFSNSQIGTKLGYSESLIRQETVIIYRRLGVNGRKAMQINSALRLEQIAKGRLSE